VTFDPLLTEQPTGDEGPAPGSDRPPYGRRRAVVAVAVAAVAVLVALLIANLVGGGDDAAAPAVSPATTTAATPSPTVVSVGPAAPATIAPPDPTVAPTAPSATNAPPTTTPAAAAMPSIDAPGSLWWLVNRDRPLPDGYVPPDLVVPNVPIAPGASAIQVSAATAAAFEAMADDAATAGYQLMVKSAYRSEDDQRALYARFVKAYGRDVAATLAAPPGTSEHQTGLALDVGLVGLPDDQVFGGTPASQWVADNAHRFGFILRYPPAKAAITGYANEPWHLRYVGVDLATVLHDNGLTMEEQFGLVPVAG
jgi:D-alanyl-D-alanine carboxypeptidase